MEINTVERAMKTEIDTRTEYKGVGKLGWFISVINRNIPITRRGPDMEEAGEGWSLCLPNT